MACVIYAAFTQEPMIIICNKLPEQFIYLKYTQRDIHRDTYIQLDGQI